MHLDEVISLLSDLVRSVPKGRYGPVEVREEEICKEYDGRKYTFEVDVVIYKGYKIYVEHDAKLNSEVPDEIAIEALWHLAREAIKRYGEEVEGWYVAWKLCDSSDVWLFFAKSRSPRIVYAVMYDMFWDAKEFAKITRNSIEWLPGEKLKEMIGEIKVHKVLPGLFYEDTEEMREKREVIFTDTIFNASFGDVEDARMLAKAFAEYLLNYVDVEILRKWLAGAEVLAPANPEIAEKIHRMARISGSVSYVIKLDEPYWRYVGVTPNLVASHCPELFKKIKQKAGMEVTVVEVTKAIEREKDKLRNPMPIERASKIVGADVTPFLPYLVDQDYLAVFKYKGKLYVYYPY